MAKEHLLFIDADKESAALMELGLRQSGYSVARAQDVQGALGLLQESAPSLIVCNLDSCADPQALLEGLQTAQKGQNDFPSIYLCDEAKRASIDSKFRPAEQDCLSKPVYLRDLIARVDLMLEQQRRALWSSREGGRSRFSGELGDLGVVDLMQTIAICKKSGVVNLNTGEGKGEIWFKKGALIDASFGKLQAEAAVYRMIRLDSGSFGVHFKSVRRAKAMSSSTNAILLEGLSQREQWQQYCEQLPCLDLPLVADPTQLGSKANADVSELLRRFKGKRSIRSVLQETRRNDLELLGLISEVYFSGALVVAGEKPEPEPVKKEEEAPVLKRRDAPSRRPISTTQPMIHDGPVARPRARPKAVTQRLPPPGSGPTAPSPAPAVDSSANSRVGRPRVGRTLVIPYSARDDAQAPGHALPSDAPVLGGTSSRRPQSSTMIYHGEDDGDVQGPFARTGNGAVAVAHQAQPQAVAANESPADSACEPPAPELKIVEDSQASAAQSGEFEAKPNESRLEMRVARERRQEMMAELEDSSRGLRLSEIQGTEEPAEEEAPLVERSANDSGSRMHVNLDEGSSGDDGRLLSAVILVACALVVAYVLGVPDLQGRTHRSLDTAHEPSAPDSAHSSVREQAPEAKFVGNELLNSGPSCQLPEAAAGVASVCEGPDKPSPEE